MSESAVDQTVAESESDTAEEAAADGESAESGTEITTVTLRETKRWTGAAGLAFLLAGVAVVTQTPTLLLAPIVFVGYLSYARAFPRPDLALSVTRSISEHEPDPGDEVTVTVTVENTGERILSDLRVVERVPEALEVSDDPPRLATALRPGAHATFEYTVLARRGEYRFEELLAIARDPSGAHERECTVRTDPTVMTCIHSRTATESVPLYGITSPYTGRVDTDTTGSGLEFHSLREYRMGDPLSRIDWNRYASSGELATVDFREERMASVVVLLDLRKAAYVQPGEDGLHAIDRSIDAAGRLFHSLLQTGDRVGLAAFAPDDIWLPPGSGPTHRANAHHLLATHPSLSPTPPDEQIPMRGLLKDLTVRLSEETQIVFISPMADDPSAHAARSLHARGHAVTVVSPDATRTDTAGRQLERLRRANRLSTLRNSGIRVVDWAEGDELATALARTQKRWSA